MDPSEDQHDDDLFADLYGDDEPPKSVAEEPTQTPTEVAPVSTQEPQPNTTSKGVAEQAAPPQAPALPPKAHDPRVPQPPTQTHHLEEEPQQQEQQHYMANQENDYSSWDASNMGPGQSVNDNQSFDHMGMNGYGDQGAGSPAIKEDGKMFIGGLNWETTDDSLKEYFSQFGEVTECTVMRDGPTGRSRGFGFLTFKDPKTVNIVMVKEHYLDGKIIDPKRAIPRDEQEKTSKIFVGGVSQEATETDFREYFNQFGRVLDATLMMDKDTGRPRGFGFVTFDNESAVENALNCPTLEIMGKPIEVKKAQPRGNTRERMNAHMEDREDRMGFRDRGNRDRFDDRGSGGGGYAGNNQQGQNGQQGAQSAVYNGMTPQMMAQYWQQMQRYMQNMTQFGRGGGMPMPIINPAMMQQALQNVPQQMAGMNPQMMQQMNMQAQAQMMRQQGAHHQSPPIQSPQQMPAQMNVAQQGAGPQGQYANQGGPGYGQGYDAQAGYSDMSQQQQGSQNAYRNHRFQNHPSQRDYQPPQSHPSSWEGMYDDVPPQQVVQQIQQQNAAAAAQQTRGATPNGQYGRFEGPPPNAPTGPRNTKPGSNYRGGRGGAPVHRGAGYNVGHRGGFHPYARNG